MSTDPQRQPLVSRETPVAPAPAVAKRVLVADDEEAVRVVLKRYFSRYGWQVVEVEDGRQAFDSLLRGTHTRFDLIVCDLRMPGMTGPELFRWMLDSQPELVSRLIFTTGDMHEHDTAEFLAATRCCVLEKPFELETLRRVIESVAGNVAAA